MAGFTDGADVLLGVPGPPWLWVLDPNDPKGRLEGGWGALATCPELSVVMGKVDVTVGPRGEEVPAVGGLKTKSAPTKSPCGDTTPPPRSMNKDRNFFSRAWMSSGLP